MFVYLHLAKCRYFLAECALVLIFSRSFCKRCSILLFTNPASWILVTQYEFIDIISISENCIDWISHIQLSKHQQISSKVIWKAKLAIAWDFEEMFVFLKLPLFFLTDVISSKWWALFNITSINQHNKYIYCCQAVFSYKLTTSY